MSQMFAEWGDMGEVCSLQGVFPDCPWLPGDRDREILSVPEGPAHAPAQGGRSREQGAGQDTLGSYFRQVSVVVFLLLQQRTPPWGNKHPELLTDPQSIDNSGLVTTKSTLDFSRHHIPGHSVLDQGSQQHPACPMDDTIAFLAKDNQFSFCCE